MNRLRRPSWLRDPFAALLDRFAPSVTLVVRPEVITFLNSGNMVQLAPRMYVDRGIVRGIGDPPLGGPFTEINVLDRSVGPEPLEKFLAHGFRLVLKRGVGPKPVVTIDLVQSSPADRAYWTSIASAAMAARVEFPAGKNNP